MLKRWVGDAVFKVFGRCGRPFGRGVRVSGRVGGHRRGCG